MRTGYNVLKNFIYMVFSNAVARVLSLVTVVYLANILGPDNFGRLNWAMVFVSYFAVAADFGRSITAARDLSADKSRLNELIGKALGFKLFFSILAFILCLLTAIILRREYEDRLLIFFSGLTIFTSVTFFLSWAFQGLEDMKHLGYSLILQSFVYAIAVLWLTNKTTPVYIMAVILFLSQAAAVIYQFYALKKFYLQQKLKFNFSDIPSTAARTAHITWSHFTLILGQNSPLFLIGLFSSPAAAGFFAASQKISSLVWEVISNFSNVLFPALARNFTKEPAKFNKIANYSLKLTFAALTPLLSSIAVLSYSITEFIYGNAFIESYWTLKIIIFLPLFMFLDSLATNILIISGRQKETSLIKTFVVFSAFILSALSVRKMGINSVAIIFVSSFLVSAAWQYKKVSDFLIIDWKNCVLLPVLFSSISAAVIFYIKNFSLLLAFLCATAGYSAMIYFYGLFDSQERDYIKNNIKTLKNRFLNLEFQ
ncbi:MAG: oligosaccharide flippase family protein [Elusimicrobiota bacterium]